MAFNALNSQRMFGDKGPQPLSLADLHALVVIQRMEAGEAAWLLDVIPRMDRIYVEETYKRINKAREDAARKQNRKAPPSGRRR